MCAQKVKGFGQFLQRYNNIFANCKTAINGTSWYLTNEGRTDWKTVDYKNDIWKEVYPELYNLDVSKMGYPAGNIYKNNLYYNSGVNTFSIEMEDTSVVENNYSASGDTGFYDINKQNYLLRDDALACQKIDIHSKKT